MSGRQSLARLAASIVDVPLHSVHITRKYGISEFREELKNLLKRIATDKKPLSFLLTERQIRNEQFVEDLLSLMSSGGRPTPLTRQTLRSSRCTDTPPTSRPLLLVLLSPVFLFPCIFFRSFSFFTSLFLLSFSLTRQRRCKWQHLLSLSLCAQVCMTTCIYTQSMYTNTCMYTYVYRLLRCKHACLAVYARVWFKKETLLSVSLCSLVNSLCTSSAGILLRLVLFSSLESLLRISHSAAHRRPVHAPVPVHGFPSPPLHVRNGSSQTHARIHEYVSLSDPHAPKTSGVFPFSSQTQRS